MAAVLLWRLVIRRSSWVPYLWVESYGARIGIMPLGGPANEIRWVEIEPSYVFHELNAFRDGDEVVIDVCRYEKMMDGEYFGTVSPELRRWRVNTAGEALSFREDVLEATTQYEFPMHDRRRTGRSNQHGWFVEARTHPETIDLGGVAHVDHRAASNGHLAVTDSAELRLNLSEHVL